MVNKKSKAMSVHSVIVGSVITAVISTSAMAIMWSSVDKTTAKSELNAIKGMIESLSTHDYILTDVSSLNMTKYMNALPNEFQYGVVTYVDNNDYNTMSNSLFAVANINDENEVHKLRVIVEELSSTLVNKIEYDTTCTNNMNCYYAISNMPKIDVRINSISSKDIINKISNLHYLFELTKNGKLNNGVETITYSSFK